MMSNPLLIAMLTSLLMLLGCAASSTSTSKHSTPLRVMSFNVRYGTAPDGEDHWTKRRELFFSTIKSHDPDLLGTQEVLASQADELRQRMPDYTFVGVGRDDGKRAGEFAAIQFRTSRFELLDKGFFWLSDRPDVPGSVGWDAALTRMVTWVKLRDRLDSSRELLYLNTHWDHKGIQAHVESAKLMRTKMREMGGDKTPIIVTGDLNSDEDSQAYQVLVQGELSDCYREAHPQRTPDEATYHAFKGDVHGSRIDFIFHTPRFKTLDATIDRMNQNGHYPSDHFPVLATLQWIAD